MTVSNFLKRTISGFLFVVILTGCIFIHPICFYVLFFVINILGLVEFSRMAKHMNIHVNLVFCIICGSVLFTVGFLHNYINYWDGYLFFFLLTFIMAIRELYRNKGNGFMNLAFSYYAILYISLPFTLLIYLPYQTSGTWMPELSEEAYARMESADVMMAKGQANFETLRCCGKNIYYLFLCKCHIFSDMFGVEPFSGILVRERDVRNR